MLQNNKMVILQSFGVICYITVENNTEGHELWKSNEWATYYPWYPECLLTPLCLNVSMSVSGTLSLELTV